MSINRVFVFAIAASFVVFGHIQTTSADKITAERVIGKWYTLAMITNATNFDTLICSQATVTKTENDQIVEVVVTGKKSGAPHKSVTKVEFLDSEIRITNQSSGHVTHVEFIANVNNGAELIFREKEGSFIYYELLSRQTTASSEIMNIMEEKAASEGLQIIPISQNDCS